MMERDDDHFDLDDDFVAESDEEQGFDRFIDTRRTRASAAAAALGRARRAPASMNFS